MSILQRGVAEDLSAVEEGQKDFGPADLRGGDDEEVPVKDDEIGRLARFERWCSAIVPAAVILPRGPCERFASVG